MNATTSRAVRACALVLVWSAALVTAPLAAQQGSGRPAPGAPGPYRFREPIDPADPLPVVFVPSSTEPSVVEALVAEHYGVCRMTQAGSEAGEKPILDATKALRQKHAIEGARFLLVGDPGTKLGADAAAEFLNAAAPIPLDGTKTVGVLAAVRALRGEAAPKDAATAAIGALLDRFCDAATRANLDRYMGMFTEDGVFLGTDATERWTVPAFRVFAEPYFKRGQGWTFIPTARHVVVAPDGATATFDEDLHSRSYGRCRGTGAVRKVGAEWKITLYGLSIPVPNDISTPIVDRIRAFEKDGAGTSGRPAPAHTIYIVRHAEKDESDPKDRDPALLPAGVTRAEALARVLASTPLAAIYTSEFRRTKDTAAPRAKAGPDATVVPARESDRLLSLARDAAPGSAVLVVSHANVIPDLLSQLGVKERVALGEHDYDDLFVVTLGADGPPLFAHLHYGARAP